MLNDVIENVKIFPDVTLVTIYNVKVKNDVLSREHIFRKFAENKINLDMISQSPCFGGDITLSFSLPDKDLAKTLEIIAAFKTEYEKTEINIRSNNLIISFNSAEMINSPGVAASVFDAFLKKSINIILVTTSDISISCLISKHDEVKTMKMLQEHNLTN